MISGEARVNSFISPLRSSDKYKELEDKREVMPR
jgi:hypothetical protein